jgi:hypothetical protein
MDDCHGGMARLCFAFHHRLCDGHLGTYLRHRPRPLCALLAGSGEVLTAVLTHQVAWSGWLALAVTGNISGGVIIVTLLEYGQVIADEEGEKAIREDAEKHKQEQAKL